MSSTSLPSAGSMEELLAWGLRFVCVWLLGLVFGWLLPKPRWVDRGLRAKALLLASPPGLWFRRVALATHGALIVREVWRNLFAPGTFRGVMKNLWRTLTTGQRFEWPQPQGAAAGSPFALAAAQGGADVAAAADSDSWYITHKDLAEFKWTIDQDGTPPGASAWERMMHKQWPGCTYTAWRRTLANGKSEYKSVTISEDATAEEFMDFYLDDETRMKWDAMISETQLLESGEPAASRCQVVRWLRTFPFAFISQREYVIARRFFRDSADGTLYACTRGLVEHPAAPRNGALVRMEDFHSHWRSRTVPCPHGSGRPACETTLLHFEDFRIPERLARFAVRHGMAGFVKGMIPAVERFVAERRQRCNPVAEDPASYGRRQLAAPRKSPAAAAGGGVAALPPPSPSATAPGLARSGSLASLASDSAYSGGSMEDSASDRSGGGRMPRTSSMRRLGVMMVASGVAMAIARTASGGSLSASSPASGHRQHGSSGVAGKRHGSQGHHAHGHRRSEHAPPRPRRRQQEKQAASVEPAVMAAMMS